MKWPDLPKKVAISLAVLAASFILFVVLTFTLGLMRDEAVAENTRLQSTLQQTRNALRQSQTDVQFVLDGTDRYEKLLAGTKLVPHARRAAVRELQSIATKFGLSKLNYSFEAANALAPTSAANQPKATDYRVNVEDIEISVGAPLDGNIYKFVDALGREFLGSAVVNRFELGRMPSVTIESLNEVARGTDSGLVKGTIKISWRTAQRNADADQVAKAGRR